MIALLTDFGLKDEYVGVMKGVIYSINSALKIVDLTHEIPPQDIIWGGYILYRSYKYFPRGTIFLALVDPGVGTKRDIIIMKVEGYYFIAPDNGLLSLIYEHSKSRRIVKVNQNKFSLKPLSATFQGRDIFAPLAGYLSRTKRLSNFGLEIDKLNVIKFPVPVVKTREIRASVIHIDRFGNIITNLEREFFQKLGWKNFKIVIKGKVIKGISSFYQKKDELIAIWESRNLLEIASPNGSASRLLGLKSKAALRIIKV